MLTLHLPALTLNGESLQLNLQSPATACFQIVEPVRLDSDPALPDGEQDLPNTGVRVLAINVETGNQTVIVVFSPLANSSRRSEKLPRVVPLRDWSLVSHV